MNTESTMQTTAKSTVATASRILNWETASALCELGYLHRIDLYFAKYLCDKHNFAYDSILFVSALLASHAVHEGDVCVDLDLISGTYFPGNDPDDEETAAINVLLPDREAWGNALSLTSVSKLVGHPVEYKPLIYDGRRVYLYRYWKYESDLAIQLVKLAAAWRDQLPTGIDPQWVQERLDAFFPQAEAEEEADWQRVAALTSLINRLVVISGGPGTGKTFTIARLLALLIEENRIRCPDHELQIRLTAPTGKAASRLAEAIRDAREAIPVSDCVKAAIPEQVSTIQRLLGHQQNSPYFRYNKENHLTADVVVVDEASMVDLPLMSKLIEALSDHARLILVGDKDQLASVAPGAVLADICRATGVDCFTHEFAQLFEKTGGHGLPRAKLQVHPPFAGVTVMLKKSRRFTDDSDIGKLGRAINSIGASSNTTVAEDVQQAVELLSEINHRNSAVSWRSLKGSVYTDATFNKPARLFCDVICEHYSGLVSAGNAEEALAVTKRFRVLTALKRGPWGAHRLNAMIEDVLNINPHQKTFYKGQPIIVTSNDYAIGLFNGDIGVVWPDGDGKLKVWFEMSHGDDIELVPMHTQMLPSHETVFAMTVHKSQGSEFNHVLTVLPPISMSVLTRELVYTALTRTRETARIWADRHVLVDALSRKTERASGLEDQLRVSGEG